MEIKFAIRHDIKRQRPEHVPNGVVSQVDARLRCVKLNPLRCNIFFGVDTPKLFIATVRGKGMSRSFFRTLVLRPTECRRDRRWRLRFVDQMRLDPSIRTPPTVAETDEQFVRCGIEFGVAVGERLAPEIGWFWFATRNFPVFHNRVPALAVVDREFDLKVYIRIGRIAGCVPTVGVDSYRRFTSRCFQFERDVTFF